MNLQKTIFAEDMMDSRLADVIAEEMEGRVLFFNPLETITKLRHLMVLHS